MCVNKYICKYIRKTQNIFRLAHKRISIYDRKRTLKNRHAGNTRPSDKDTTANTYYWKIIVLIRTQLAFRSIKLLLEFGNFRFKRLFGARRF